MRLAAYRANVLQRITDMYSELSELLPTLCKYTNLIT
jgi:hypothetical protein